MVQRYSLKSTSVEHLRMVPLGSLGIVPKRPISGGFNLTLGMMLPGLS